MHKRPDGYYRRVAEVMNLRDGDTIDVDLPNLPGVAIRLSGFNAPELDDPGGEEAAEFVANLFETHRSTRYRRTSNHLLTWTRTVDLN